MYGWRGRIGLLVPAGNSVMEPEFQRMAPEGGTGHAHRVALKDVTPACRRPPPAVRYCGRCRGKALCLMPASV